MRIVKNTMSGAEFDVGMLVLFCILAELMHANHRYRLIWIRTYQWHFGNPKKQMYL